MGATELLCGARRRIPSGRIVWVGHVTRADHLRARDPDRKGVVAEHFVRLFRNIFREMALLCSVSHCLRRRLVSPANHSFAGGQW